MAPPPRPSGAAAARLLARRAGVAMGNAYSRRVARLKLVLPAIGLGLLLLVAMWPRLAPLWERMRFALPAIDLRDARELRMLNPRYAGTDRENRPFVVTASSGRQVPDRNDLMSLEAPQADLKTHGGADVVVTAATGIYQSQAQLLDLFGDVTLTHQNGTRFTTDTARVNVADNTAQGDDPIHGHGPSGDIRSQGFRVLDKGDTIIFTGRSDLLLNGAKENGPKAEPPALPPSVAQHAAAVESEAKPALAAAAKAEAARHPPAHQGTRRPPAHRAPAHHAAARHHPRQRAAHDKPKSG
jgi:lipopolysaccharide export system protein LptC